MKFPKFDFSNFWTKIGALRPNVKIISKYLNTYQMSKDDLEALSKDMEVVFKDLEMVFNDMERVLDKHSKKKS